ncbi:Hypothetical protein HVR_LOCUS294 [uncultured virus]|nr:Hypothetical protein HVR_LOCUS294 [uncultured virus]
MPQTKRPDSKLDTGHRPVSSSEFRRNSNLDNNYCGYNRSCTDRPVSNKKQDHSNNEDKGCGTGKFTIFFDDFTCGLKPGITGSPYNFFSAPPIIPLANDAAVGVSVSKDNLVIHSTPFTFSTSSPLDHVKYLVYQKPYKVPRCGAEIVYEGVVSVLQTGLGGILGVPGITGTPGGVTGIVNVNSDVRLAAGGFNVLDPETFMIFDFLISNEDIYAFYGRSPSLRIGFGGPGPNYLAFSHGIPVAKRNVSDPANDFIKLAIAYNYQENYVRWIVNDQEIFRVNRIGFPLERKYRLLEYTTLNPPGTPYDPSFLLRPKQLQFGFGTFSLMDMYNPQNPGQLPNVGLFDLTNGQTLPESDPIAPNVNGTPRPATFIVSPYPGTTNFGQGVVLIIKYLTVYVQAPIETIRKFPDLFDCEKCLLISRCCQNNLPGVNSDSDLFNYRCKGFIKDCNSCACVFNPCQCKICGTGNQHNCEFYTTF